MSLLRVSNIVKVLDGKTVLGNLSFELNEGEHHDHLVCVQCGKVVEFFDEEIERRQKMIAKDRGFELHDHALSLYGSCTKTDCENRRK